MGRGRKRAAAICQLSSSGSSGHAPTSLLSTPPGMLSNRSMSNYLFPHELRGGQVSLGWGEATTYIIPSPALVIASRILQTLQWAFFLLPLQLQG